MKKYLLGIVAVVVAVTLSSFTNHAPKVAKETAPFANWYWYPVNAAGQTTAGSFNPATLKSKSFAMTNYVPTCTDVFAQPYCALGSSTNNLAVGTTISSPAPDATIRHDD